MIDNSSPILLLDLDGVCTAFVEEALKLVNIRLADVHWPPGQYDIPTVLGMNRRRFWEIIAEAGMEFWRRMPSYPWFEELYSELQHRGKVYFATAPTSDPSSAAGKIAWLKDRFGNEFQDFIITERKYLLSNPNTILIDDSDRNIQDFVRKGWGRAVLFPQVWNTAYSSADGNRVGRTLNQVDKALKEMRNV